MPSLDAVARPCHEAQQQFRGLSAYPEHILVFVPCRDLLIMDSEEIPTFSSPKEETAYWKELSLKYKQRYCCRFADSS